MMKLNLILFTKKNKEYEPFIELCQSFFEKVEIVYQDEHPRKIDKEYSSFLRRLEDFSPDFVISFFYGRIIRKSVLNLSNFYSLNFHPSILPNYAGAHSLNWQIINGEREGGVTIHELTPKVDGGRIGYQEKFNIKESDTINEVLRKSIKASCRLLPIVMKDFCEFKYIDLKEQKINGTEFKCRLRTPEDGEINKDMSVEDIIRASKALAFPWPGIYYKYIDRIEQIDSVVSSYKAIDILRKLNE